MQAAAGDPHPRGGQNRHGVKKIKTTLCLAVAAERSWHNVL